MSGPSMSRHSKNGGLARLAVTLYPAAWRSRYADEVRVYLADSGGGPRAAASLAWRAIPAWLRPPGHLHDGPARTRASLATVLTAWVVLAGLGAVFVQLTQNQPEAQAAAVAGHPVISWAYWVFDTAAVVSVLAIVAGGLPLWWRLAALTMSLAGAASIAAAAGLYRWASPEAGYHQSWPLGIYVPAVALAAAVALVSAARGIRASRPAGA